MYGHDTKRSWIFSVGAGRQGGRRQRAWAERRRQRSRARLQRGLRFEPLEVRAMLAGDTGSDALSPIPAFETGSGGYKRLLWAQAQSGSQLVPAPEIDVFEGSRSIPDGTNDKIIFPTSSVGQPGATVEFRVMNLGGGVLTVSSIQLPAGFQFSGTAPGRIDLTPGASRSFTVQVVTSSSGTRSGRMYLYNNDSDENPYDFPLEAVVVSASPPEIEVTQGGRNIVDGNGAAGGTLVDFGVASVGDTAPTRVFRVRNVGHSLLTLGSVTVPAGYTLLEGLRLSLAPQEFDDFTVRLDTGSSGIKAGRIQFANNDADENPFDFPITGQVVAALPQVSVVASDALACESGDPGLFRVTRTGPTTSGLSVQVAFPSGAARATAGFDYQAIASPVWLPPGQASVNLPVLPLDDGLLEPEREEVVLNLVPHSAYSLGTPASAAVQIRDDELEITVADAQLVEGDSGSRELLFEVRLSRPSCRELVLHYATADGDHADVRRNAHAADRDYLPAQGTINIPAGASSATIRVTVYGDTKVEWDEDLQLRVWPAAGMSFAQVKDGHALGTILNDDVRQQALVTISDVTVVEGDVGYVNADFTLNLSLPLGEPLLVYYTTVDDTARVADGDYEPASATVTFAPGQTVHHFSVRVWGDLKDEWDEEFLVFVSMPSGQEALAVLADIHGIGKILDDDPKEGPEFRRILHKSQCYCGSEELALQTKDGGFVLPLRPADSALLAYFGDATFNPAGHLSNFLLRVPAHGSSAPLTRIEIEVQIDGLVTSRRSLTSGLAPGTPLAFATHEDLSGLSSGPHLLEVTATGYVGEQAIGHKRLTDVMPVINLEQSPYGERWWFPFLDRLVVGTVGEHSGAAYLQGSNVAWWFKEEKGAYLTPDGLFADLTRQPTSSGQTAYHLRDKFGNVSEFTAAGLLEARRDRLGNRTRYRYTDANGDGRAEELQMIVDPFGRVTNVEYVVAAGVLQALRITDYAGRATTLHYDLRRQVTAVTYPDPDSDGPAAAPVDGFGYDLRGRLTSYTDAEGHTTRLEYDHPTPRAVTIVQPDELQSRWTYTPAQANGLTDWVPPEELFGRFRDGRGYVTSYLHDDFGNALVRIDAAGNAAHFARNVHGLVTRAIDEGGLVSDFVYDARGNLVREKQPDGSYRHWSYDAAFSRVTGQTDELGQVIEYRIDPANGNLLERHQALREPALVQPRRGGDPRNAWQNSVDRYDVNGDGVISGSDALVLVNELNATGPRALPPPPNPADVQGRWLDVNGDGFLTPLDQMVLLNLVNGLVTRVDSTFYTYSGGGPNMAAGLLTSVTDSLGIATTYAYGAAGTAAAGWLTSVTSAVGTPAQATVRYEYDEAGNLTAVSDELGRRTTARYDWLDRLTETLSESPGFGAASPMGLRQLTRLAYDRVGNLVGREEYEVAAPGGPGTLLQQHHYVYDGLGRLRERLDPDPLTGLRGGPRTAFTYDANGNLLSVQDAEGRLTALAYDALNRLMTRIDPAPQTGDHAAPVTWFEYDAVGNVTGVTDPLGRKTEYRYDARRRVVERSDPPARPSLPLERPRTSFRYDAAGRLVQIRDPLGRSVDLVYDEAGRLLRAVEPRTTYTADYDLAGRLLFEVDGLGQVSGYQYDARHRLVRRTAADPDGRQGPERAPETTYVHDAAGQLLAATDPLGRTTQFLYDGRGRRISTQGPDPDGPGAQQGSVSLVQYDTLGNRLSEANARGEATRYQYDRLQRPLQQTDAAGGVTLWGYDRVGNLLRQTDPRGNVTGWTYDGLNRPVKETDLTLNRSRLFAYDAVGNLQRQTDRNGRTITYTYDGLDRRVQEAWGTARTFSYEYDLAGQVVAASDAKTASYSFTYDQGGNMVLQSQQLAASGLAGTVTLSAEYNANAQRTRLAVGWQQQIDLVNQYTYDGLSRLTQITQAGERAAGKRVDFTYDPAGQLRGMSRFLDTAGRKPVARTDLAYDGAGRLVRLEHHDSHRMLAGYAYGYDGADRLISIANEVHPAESVRYEYDALGQVTVADYAGGNSSRLADEFYGYDAAGNRTNPGYATIRNNRLERDGEYFYQYDWEGNRTRRTRLSDGQVTDYVWDERNRLASLVERDAAGRPLLSASYTYDVFDRRLSKTVDADGSGPLSPSREVYVYDGEHVVLLFRDANTRDSEPPVLAHRFLHGPAVDMILADEQVSPGGLPGTVRWPLADQLGTVRDLAVSEGDGRAVIANHLVYDSYGRIVSETAPAVDFLFGFTGRERDEESGLHFYRARYYDPAVGRFLSEDPSGFSAGDANLYRYVGNGPSSATDPSGRETRQLPHRETTMEPALPWYESWWYTARGRWNSGQSLLSDPRGHEEINVGEETRIAPHDCGDLLPWIAGNTYHRVGVPIYGAGKAVAYDLPVSVGHFLHHPIHATKEWYASMQNLMVIWDDIPSYKRADMLLESGLTAAISGQVYGLAARVPGRAVPRTPVGIMKTRLQRLGYDEANTVRIINAIQNGEQIAVIGENMKRVQAISRMVGTAGGRPVSYTPRKFTGVNKNSMNANRSWMRYWVRDKQTTTIDIGRQPTPRSRGPSPFYELEHRLLKHWEIYTPIEN